MPYTFDTDALGAVLSFAMLHRAHPPPIAARAEWEAANLLRARGSFAMPAQLWLGPALTRTMLEDALVEGRKKDEVRRTLQRAFRVLENHHLLEALPGDDNPSTKYRVITTLGEELVREDAHQEYVNGLPYVVSRWSPSVVCLVGKESVGTGFFISPRQIATARHVVDGLGPFTVMTTDGVYLDVVVATTRRPKDAAGDLDVAIVELDRDVPGAKPMRFAPDRSLLDEVVAFGFPPVPWSSGPHLLVTRGEVSAELVLRDGLQVILVTCLLRGGYSGGPVMNRRGAVIGLVSRNLFNQIAPGDQSINEGLGFAAVVPAEWIQDLAEGKV